VFGDPTRSTYGRVSRGTHGPIEVRYSSNIDQIDALQKSAALCQQRTYAPQKTTHVALAVAVEVAGFATDYNGGPYIVEFNG
jgi:hypothetical protein